MKKTLYFEGAGCVACGEIENCRIRTAFIADDGKSYYLEITGLENNKYNNQPYDFTGFVSHSFCITDEKKRSICNDKKVEYTKKALLAFINKHFNCSYTELIALPNLSGYRVHNDKGGYNVMDAYKHDPKLIERREWFYNECYEAEKLEGKKYPNFSLWVDKFDKEKLHLLKHYNGYNKHFNVTMVEGGFIQEETILGQYGC